MRGLRKTLYHFTGVANKFLLFILPAVFAISIITSNVAYADRALSASRVYDNLVPVIVDGYKQSSNSPVLNQLLAIPEVRTAIEQSFPKEQVQANSDAALRATLDWVQGRADKISFRIDLTNAKANLVSQITNYITTKINSLPVCSLAQLQQQASSSNLLDLTCRPAGVDMSSLIHRYVTQIVDSIGILADPIITSEMLPRDNQGRTIEQRFHNLPTQYKLFNIGKWIIAGLALLLSLLLVFARKNKLRGLRHLAWELVGVGLIILIVLASYKFMSGQSEQAAIVISDNGIVWHEGINSLVGDASRIIVWFSGSYLIFGLLSLLFVRLVRPKVAKPVTPADPNLLQ